MERQIWVVGLKNGAEARVAGVAGKRIASNFLDGDGPRGGALVCGRNPDDSIAAVFDANEIAAVYMEQEAA